MVSFVDYTFYKNQYKGSILDDATFSNLSLKATFYLKSQIDDLSTTEEVQHCICALADEMQSIQKGKVSSVSNDGYSESYSFQQKEDKKRLYEVVEMYIPNLLNTVGWI